MIALIQGDKDVLEKVIIGHKNEILEVEMKQEEAHIVVEWKFNY